MVGERVDTLEETLRQRLTGSGDTTQETPQWDVVDVFRTPRLTKKSFYFQNLTDTEDPVSLA